MLMSSTGLPIVKYGYLYNYYVIEGTGNASIIPLAMANDGWVINTGLLSNRDIATLANYNGGSMATLGAVIKETSNTYWVDNVGALNSYNFNARGAGFRQYNDGAFSSLNYQLRLWDAYVPQAVYLVVTNNGITTGFDDATGKKSMGGSIRLVRPATVSEQLQTDGSVCVPYVGNDGLKYPTIKVGTQVWLGCNLAETKYRGGTDITYISDNATWGTANFDARCAYDNDMNNVFMSSYPDNFAQKTVKYGYLYNAYVALATGDSSVISLAMSNAGWGIPIGSQITTLASYIGGYPTGGGKLKEAGVVYWNIPNAGATNQYNFSMRGTGARDESGGSFGGITTVGTFWTTYPGSVGATYGISFYSDAQNFGFVEYYNKRGLAIRLVRPASVSEQLQVDGSACTPYVGNDGLQYPTIKVGTQVWLAVNLAETKLRNGSEIPNVTNNATWASLTTIGRCAYNNDINNVFI